MNPLTQTNRKESLPLVRLSLLIPFEQELDRRRLDIVPVLYEFDLTRETLESPDVFVPAQTIYRLLEALAGAADDPFLAVFVGDTLDLFSWPVFTNAAKQAVTFSDFFYRFSAEAGNQANSVKMCLDTDGAFATFRAHRVFEPDMSPAQADAFYVGLFRSIFQRCAGTLWNPQEVRIRVCDPNAIPQNYHDLLVSRGNRRGCSIRFPQAWLLLPFSYENFKQRMDQDIRYQSPPISLNESVRQTLLPHIHKKDLNTDYAAKLCGYNKQILGRRLRAEGTTLINVIVLLKEVLAVQALLETDQPVAEIGNSIGISNASVFTRSFKNWTGLSPSEYRKRCKTDVE